jgi:hypothetical protein
MPQAHRLARSRQAGIPMVTGNDIAEWEGETAIDWRALSMEEVCKVRI